VERTCKKCGKTKGLEDFTKNKKCNLGRTHICKKCSNEYNKTLARKCSHTKWEQYKKSHPNYKEIDRAKHLKRCYGLSILEWDKVYEKQKGCCLICGRHQSELGRVLQVHHNHKTGKVKGLLCVKCNTTEGWFRKHQKNYLRYLGLNITLS